MTVRHFRCAEHGELTHVAALAGAARASCRRGRSGRRLPRARRRGRRRARALRRRLHGRGELLRAVDRRRDRRRPAAASACVRRRATVSPSGRAFVLASAPKTSPPSAVADVDVGSGRSGAGPLSSRARCRRSDRACVVRDVRCGARSARLCTGGLSVSSRPFARSKDSHRSLVACALGRVRAAGGAPARARAAAGAPRRRACSRPWCSRRAGRRTRPTRSGAKRGRGGDRDDHAGRRRQRRRADAAAWRPRSIAPRWRRRCAGGSGRRSRDGAPSPAASSSCFTSSRPPRRRCRRRRRRPPRAPAGAPLAPQPLPVAVPLPAPSPQPPAAAPRRRRARPRSTSPCSAAARPPSRGASDFQIRVGAAGGDPARERLGAPEAGARESCSPTKAARGTPSRSSCAASTRARARTSSSPSAASRSTRAATCTATATPTRTSSFPSWSSRCACVEGPFDPRQGNFAVAGSADYQLGLAAARAHRQLHGRQLRDASGCSGSGDRRARARTPSAGAEIYKTDGFGQNRDAQRGSAMGQYEGRFGATGIWRLTGAGLRDALPLGGRHPRGRLPVGEDRLLRQLRPVELRARARSPRGATPRATRSPPTSRRTRATRCSRSRCSSSSATCACSRTSPASCSTCRSRCRACTTSAATCWTSTSTS